MNEVASGCGMESKVNYTIVGLFVVLLTSGLLGFAYWLAKHGNQEDYVTYRVYMSESVAGLTNDAAVKYRGVDVGTVTRMELVPDNPEHVMLTLHIRRGTPVTTDTRASIRFYGVTGLGYIELQGSSREAPALKAKDGKIPVIKSTPSTFARLDEGLSELADKSTQALDRIGLLLNDGNLQNFSELLNESRLLISELRKQTVHLGVFIDKGIMAEQKISAAFDEVGASADGVRSSAESVKRMTDELRLTYVALGQDLQRHMTGVFIRLNQLLENFDVLSRQLQRSVSEFNAAPADLLFKRSTPRPGPGEKP